MEHNRLVLYTPPTPPDLVQLFTVVRPGHFVPPADAEETNLRFSEETDMVNIGSCIQKWRRIVQSFGIEPVLREHGDNRLTITEARMHLLRVPDGGSVATRANAVRYSSVLYLASHIALTRSLEDVGNLERIIGFALEFYSTRNGVDLPETALLDSVPFLAFHMYRSTTPFPRGGTVSRLLGNRRIRPGLSDGSLANVFNAVVMFGYHLHENPITRYLDYLLLGDRETVTRFQDDNRFQILGRALYEAKIL